MGRFYKIIAAALLVVACGKNAAHQGTDNTPADAAPISAPQGMTQVAASGTGRAFSTHFSGSNSATKLMQAFIMGTSTYFDGPLKIDRAIQDKQDAMAQAAFTATLHKVPVRGLLSVVATGDGGQGQMIVDYADRLPQSFKPLITQASAQMPAPAMAAIPAVRLKTTRFSDGSGSVGLASGWRIRDSSQGSAEIDGPGGAYIALGGHQLMTTAQYASAHPQVPYVSSLDPVRSLQEVMQETGQRSGRQIAVQVMQARPVQWQNGNAALVRYRLTSGGKSIDTYALLAVSQARPDQVMGYYTEIQAPPQTFARILPTALTIWSSWSNNPKSLSSSELASAAGLGSAPPNYSGAAAMAGPLAGGVPAGVMGAQNPDTGSSYDAAPLNGGAPAQPQSSVYGQSGQYAAPGGYAAAPLNQGGYAYQGAAGTTTTGSTDTDPTGQAEASRMNESAADAWDEYIRGTTMVEHTNPDGTVERKEMYQEEGTALAKEFPDEYREVPLGELAPDANGNYVTPDGSGGYTSSPSDNSGYGAPTETPAPDAGYAAPDSGYGSGYSAPADTSGYGGGYEAPAPDAGGYGGGYTAPADTGSSYSAPVESAPAETGGSSE
jgi:hypothetical protein